MDNILIIKTGAAGDVVRTTSLLNVVEGNIYWIIAEKNKPLLPADLDLTVLSLKEAFSSLKTLTFDRVISLEEDRECARLAAEVKTKDLTGIYYDKNKINYTDNSACWFDLSQVSKLGLAQANALKAGNRESYQSFIFKMLGKDFSGQPYRIFKDGSATTKDKLIGIEKRSGKQWPNKHWWGYDELICQLEKTHRPFKVFEQRANVRDYLGDIAECSHVVSGDTLAMHVAMAYHITCSTIFNCTSPSEIYDYGLMTKIISPLLDRYFYSTTSDDEVIKSVSVEEVYDSLPVFE